MWWGGRGFSVCDGVLVLSGCVCGGRSGGVCVVGVDVVSVYVMVY